MGRPAVSGCVCRRNEPLNRRSSAGGPFEGAVSAGNSSGRDIAIKATTATDTVAASASRGRSTVSGAELSDSTTYTMRVIIIAGNRTRAWYLRSAYRVAFEPAALEPGTVTHADTAAHFRLQAADSRRSATGIVQSGAAAGQHWPILRPKHGISSIRTSSGQLLPARVFGRCRRIGFRGVRAVRTSYAKLAASKKPSTREV